MSLTLDMCTPGTTEPYGALLSPREQSTQEYLQKASNVLTAAKLHARALDDATLQSEFYVSPHTPPTPHSSCSLQHTLNLALVTWLWQDCCLSCSLALITYLNVFSEKKNRQVTFMFTDNLDAASSQIHSLPHFFQIPI